MKTAATTVRETWFRETAAVIASLRGSSEVYRFLLEILPR